MVRLHGPIPLRIAGFVIGLLSVLVPKKPRSILFLPLLRDSKRFSGNLKPVYLACRNVRPAPEAVWATSDRSTTAWMKRDGLPVVRYRRFPLWPALRAAVIAVDSNPGWLVNGRFEIVQLWHGTGFKNICLLNEREADKARRLIPLYSKYRLIIASSQADKKRKVASFGNARVAVTGSPRNDMLKAEDHERSRLRARWGLEGYLKIILYAPTFRDRGGQASLSAEFWNEIDRWLERADGLLIVKRHVNDRTRLVPEGLRAVVDLTEEVADVQELLVVADMLVSDYSGIATDFLMLERPVVFDVRDMDEYVSNSRSFYYDLESALPGPFARTERQLLNYIRNDSWFADPEYKERYLRSKRLFHEFEDGRSTERVTAEIMRLLDRRGPERQGKSALEGPSRP